MFYYLNKYNILAQLDSQDRANSMYVGCSNIKILTGIVDNSTLSQIIWIKVTNALVHSLKGMKSSSTI